MKELNSSINIFQDNEICTFLKINGINILKSTLIYVILEKELVKNYFKDKMLETKKSGGQEGIEISTKQSIDFTEQQPNGLLGKNSHLSKSFN